MRQNTMQNQRDSGARPMHGADVTRESLFTTVHQERFVPADHPLRPIRGLVNEALKRLSGLFSFRYSTPYAPSVCWWSRFLTTCSFAGLWGSTSTMWSGTTRPSPGTATGFSSMRRSRRSFGRCWSLPSVGAGSRVSTSRWTAHSSRPGPRTRAFVPRTGRVAPAMLERWRAQAPAGVDSDGATRSGDCHGGPG